MSNSLKCAPWALDAWAARTFFSKRSSVAKQVTFDRNDSFSCFNSLTFFIVSAFFIFDLVLCSPEGEESETRAEGGQTNGGERERKREGERDMQ